MNTIKIYTDGSSLGNPGPSGYAYCIIQDQLIEYESKGFNYSTNNRMELLAIIKSLEKVDTLDNIGGSTIQIYTDSKLSINCATGKWKRKSNLDLWKDFDKNSSRKNIEFFWVKAHSGNLYNEKVDKLARAEARKKKRKLKNK